MRAAVFGVGLVAVVLICGCATGYHKSGLTGGYTDQRLSESAYYVDFSGNGYATGERVHNFWLYRCAELTLEHGFDYMVLRPGKRETAFARPEGAAPRSMPAVWHPEDRGGVIKTGSGGGYSYYYVPGTTITTYSAKGTVLMYHRPLPDELPWAIDARKLQEQLKPYVDSNGVTPAPDLRKIAYLIGAAHEAVTLPRADQITVEPREGAPAGAVLRPADEFVDEFADNLIKFHVLFHGRRSITGGTDGGRIVLSLRVTPNGDVSDAHVENSSFKDYSFVEAVRTVVREMKFKPRDVESTRVQSFPIEFAPLE